VIVAAETAFWVGSFFIGLGYLATLVCVVDALRIPDATWAAAEQHRTAWIVLMLVLPVVFVAYWFSVKPQLRAAQPR
jgi:hypothetical protein